MSRIIYQKRVPLVLVTIFIVLFWGRYFLTPYAPLTSIGTELTAWAAIMATMTIFYSQIVLLLSNIRNVMERGGKAERDIAGRRLFRSIMFFAGLFFFGILALSTPSLERGATFALVFGIIISGIGLATNTRWLELCWGGLTTFRVANLETLVMFIVALTQFLREASMIVYFAPWTSQVGLWTMDTFHVAAQRAALGAAAVGTVALSIRALAMREPGLIETEAV